ncbi:MAG: 50S ribosomal protein L18 [Pseudomonadales bacterium]|nr:50S ribosomal protein L18 [Pseudomonadales bacterium]
MSKISHHTTKAENRKKRVRSKIFGTTQKPRVSVFRANKYSYIQVIDDSQGKTLMTVSDILIRKELKKAEVLTKTQSVIKATEELIAKMKKAKIASVVFDRGQYKYHGRVKAIAETLRNGGIKV